MYFIAIKKIFKLFSYLIAPIYIISVLLLKKLIVIRLCYLPAHRIGEITGEVGVYLSQKKKINKNYFDIFFVTDNVCNKYLIYFLKKKINIWPNLIFQPLHKIIIELKKIFPSLGIFVFNTDYRDRNFYLSKSNNLPKFSKEEKKKGEKLISKMGINKNDKIVCLITRDPSYLKYKFPNTNSSEHDFRNCKIKNYYKSVNFLISIGYKILRMGEVYEDNLKIKNKNFINYGKKFRTEFLDIYLGYRCNFVITSVTGWDIVPSYLFKKPVLWTNLIPYQAALPYNEKFIFLPKKCVNKKNKKKLSLKKLSKYKGNFFNTSFYKKNFLEIKENTNEEIYQATKEMLAQIKKKKVKLSKIQKIFWENFDLLFNQENLIYNKNRKPKGVFSNNFLKRNLYLLK